MNLTVQRRENEKIHTRQRNFFRLNQSFFILFGLLNTYISIGLVLIRFSSAWPLGFSTYMVQFEGCISCRHMWASSICCQLTYRMCTVVVDVFVNLIKRFYWALNNCGTTMLRQDGKAQS